MPDTTLNTIAIALIASSVAVIAVVGVLTAVRRPGAVRPEQRRKQLDRLSTAAQEAGRDERIVIDWIKYRDLSKAEIRHALGRSGWHYDSQDIRSEGWLLSFARQPRRAGQEFAATDPRQRLADELANAEPGADGQYVLNTTRFLDLQLDEIARAARVSGWEVEGLAPETPRSTMVLRRPGSSPVGHWHGPFLGDSVPDELRRNPAVLERAREIERVRGFDPLSERELNQARERHKHWARKFNRQVACCFATSILGLIVLGATFGSFEPADGQVFYVMLAIAIVLLLLALLAATRAVLIRRQRKAEIGDVLDAYEQLRRMHKEEKA